MAKLSFYILLSLMAVTQKSFSQNVNLTIQINDKLFKSRLYCSISFDSTNKNKTNVWYVPGELMLDTLSWNKINRDSTKSIWLHFSVYDKFRTNSYSVELTARQLKKDYLILSVYDFSDRKYKRWYQWLTDKNYIVEIGCEGCGTYIKHR